MRSGIGRNNAGQGLFIGSHSLLKNDAEVLGDGNKLLMGSCRNRRPNKFGEASGDFVKGAGEGAAAMGLIGTRGESGLSHSELVCVLE